MKHFNIIVILLRCFNFKILATSSTSQQNDHSASSSDNSLQSYHSTASSFNNSPRRPKQQKKEIVWQDLGIVERHDEIQWHDKHIAKDKHIIQQNNSGASSSRITPLIGEVSTLSAGHLSRSPPHASPPRTRSRRTSLPRSSTPRSSSRYTTPLRLSPPRNRISPRREVVSFSPSPPRERRTRSHNNTHHQQLSTSRSRQIIPSEQSDIDIQTRNYRNRANRFFLRGNEEYQQSESNFRSRSRSP